MDIPGADLAQTELRAIPAQAHGLAVTGLADIHAFSDLVAQKVAAAGGAVKADVQKVETSHTALFLAGMVVGAILGALAAYAVMLLR